jgi:hypothetical protein
VKKFPEGPKPEVQNARASGFRMSMNCGMKIQNSSSWFAIRPQIAKHLKEIGSGTKAGFSMKARRCVVLSCRANHTTKIQGRPALNPR